jgi:hypothetical protein
MLFACSSKHSFYLAKTDNPVQVKNSLFSGEENLSNPRFEAFKRKYQLDSIVGKETDDWRRIILLRHWVKSKMKIGLTNLYHGPMDAETILDSAAKGSVFHCGHFTMVQNAVLNAFGYVTRCLGSGPGLPGLPDQHHAMKEVWIRQFQKWVMSDAKYDHHFEQNGIPLSALEIRNAYLKNKAKDILMVCGPERKILSRDTTVAETAQEFAQTFTWLEWDVHTNRFSAYPNYQEKLLMYRDSFFNQGTWLWNGKPHWAYNTAFLEYSSHPEAIYWSPNTISASIRIQGDKAHILLSSETPNLKTYQYTKDTAGDWKSCDPDLDVRLKEPDTDLYFRAENLAGVTGSVYHVKFCQATGSP